LPLLFVDYRRFARDLSSAWLPLLFAAYVCLSLFWSQAAGTSARAGLQYFSHILCAYIAARTVSAELDTRLNLNDIGLVTVTAARPLVFDGYEQNRTTGSFIVIDPATNATAGAGMIVRALDEEPASTAGIAAAERIARAARSAPSEEAAIDAVRRLLEDLLT